MDAGQTWKEAPADMPEFFESADSFVRLVRGDKGADHDEIMVYRSGSRFAAIVRSFRRQWLELLPGSIVATNGRLKTLDEALEWAKSEADKIPARLAFAALEVAFAALALVPNAQAALDAARAEEREACAQIAERDADTYRAASDEIRPAEGAEYQFQQGRIYAASRIELAIRARSNGGA